MTIKRFIIVDEHNNNVDNIAYLTAEKPQGYVKENQRVVCLVESDVPSYLVRHILISKEDKNIDSVAYEGTKEEDFGRKRADASLKVAKEFYPESKPQVVRFIEEN